MIFLDTNVCFELLANSSPQKPHEIKQAELASAFMKENKEPIVTCKEQQIEMISAVEKRKLREYRSTHKASGESRIGSVKEFRRKKEFEEVVYLCKSIFEDMKEMATIDSKFSYSVEDVLEKITDMDIQDSMFLHYCEQGNIKLITFDEELAAADKTGKIVMLLGSEYCNVEEPLLTM